MSRRAFLAGAALSAAGCSASTGGLPELRLATGPGGGPYEMLGDRFAPELRRDGFQVTVIKTAASVQNLSMLTDGRADLGFSLADSADDAVRKWHQPVMAMARMYMNYVHLVVSKDSPVRTPNDLAARAVSIGADGSGTAVTATRILEAANLKVRASVVMLGLDESINALKRDDLAAFFWSGGVPTPALSTLKGIRLVPLEQLVPVLRRSYGPVYEHASFPVGVYGIAKPVPTVGTPSYLMCRKSLPDDVAFTVTETLFRARDRLQAPTAPGGRLDTRYAIGTGVVPLHPGAARYYRSVFG
ncbi:MAG: TAXI family TRAP transporter solute-binding subunit [Nonomuraea sp.]|nr:TAXI family TRAP transporter solute-binding subunit [Nonomuraea sp.]